MRNDYQDVADFTTEYNTVNLIHRRQAGIGMPSLSIQLLRYYTKELMAYESKNTHDISLYYQVWSSSFQAGGELLEQYFKARLGRETAGKSNEEMHRMMIQIIRQVKQDRKSGGRTFTAARKLVVE